MADVTAYDPVFEAAGNEWNVDPQLLKAMAIQESGGNPRAVSGAGAQGVMQIIPSTQKYLGVTDPNDPVQSIYGAAKYMNEALDKEGSPEKALLYYHGGPGWRQNYGSESAAYVPAITAHYQRLRTTNTAAASPAPTSQPLIIGDSLASKQGLGGTGVVGAQPKAVLDGINGLPDDQVKGRDVILSGGASNNPAQASLVYDQVKALKDRGANSVTVVGVGDRPDLAGVNDTLAMVTGRAGGRFVSVPTDQLSGDRIHPTPQGYRTLLAAATPNTATDATIAGAPASAAPTGAGNAMASNDPLSLLPPAPKPSAGGAATAAPDDPLSLLPPAPKPAGTAATTQDTTPTAETVTIDPTTGAPMMTSGPPVAPGPAAPGDVAVERIGQAAKEGWEGVPAIPRVPTNLVMSPIYNPLIAASETALRAGGGVLRGLQQTAVETLPNQLGRDVAALPEAFPFGMNALRAPGRPPIPEAPPPGPRFVQELYGEGTPSNPLAAAPAAERPAFVPPGVNIPPRPVEPPAFIPPKEPYPVPGAAREAPATGPTATAAPVTEHTPWVSSTTADIQRVLQENAETGGPTSLGAMATPEQLAKMTPAQVKANRRVAELNQIVTPIEGEDTTEWVRGSTPTEAERMGTPTTSQKERITQERNPDAFEGPNGVRTINDRARVNAFDETLLSDTQAADLKERQQAAASEAQGRILSTAKPVDLKPAADWIEAKLADPLIQEDKHVYNSLKGLRDQLYDADGNLKTDPRAAWGMHNNLRNKLLDAKDPFSANPSEKYAVTQTNEFKGLVDSALDKASDGQFRTHLDNQAEFLKSLNAWRLLNDFRYGPNKMINTKTGMINGNAFHRFVTDLAIRRGRPGIDAAMDVPDNVMQRLINIDQDLKRAGRIDLGKPRGSQTNLFFELAGALGITGAHALTAAVTAGTPFGGIANIGVQTGIGAVQRRLGQRRINRLTEQALQPPPGGLTLPPGNPLQQPP